MNTLPGTRVDVRAQWLVAVDPGTQTAGVAVFDVKGVLRAADYVKALPAYGLHAPDRAPHMAVETHRRALRLLGELSGWRPGNHLWGTVAVEYQQLYRHGEGAKAEPDDILAVNLMAGGVLTLFHDALQHLRPRPAEWKGQVPPKIMARRVVELLSAEERPLALALKAQGDAMHAVGVGLWAFGRLG